MVGLSDDERERERMRVRDLLRYYTPDEYRLTRQREEDEAYTKHKQKSKAQGNDRDERPECAEPSTGGPDPDKLLKHDPTLTAFAQLGAFKLDTERSYISLMDTENQYIIAEATRSTSLYDRDKCDEGDEISLGARILDVNWGICPNTIQVFTATDDSKHISTPLITANSECYVMNDLSAMEQFKDRSYVLGWPYMRFYAEVPIHSPTGHVIGTYCVVDNRPRDGLDARGLKILNEISSAIMSHLDLVHKRLQLELEEKMVKGLGLFVNGKSTFQDDLSSRTKVNGPISTSLWEDAEEFQTPMTSSPTSKDDVTPSSTKYSGGEEQAFPFPDMTKLMENTRPSLSRSSSAETACQESITSTRIKRLFSRASHLVLESMDLDGVIFVDACFRDTVVGRSKKAVNGNAFNGLTYHTPFDIDSKTNTNMAAPSSMAISVEDAVNTPCSDRKRPSKLLTSDVLGYAIRQPSEPTVRTLAQSTVKGLMTCYGQGRIFFFNDDGSLDHSAEPFETCEESPKNIGPGIGVVAAWAKQLSYVCPGARAIIFFPLWDPQRDQWFAGSFAWTRRPVRILNARDLNYLSAFGSCVMTEKSRLDAELADRAKSDFISVVSHELRSPLHGVLANAEALRDTSTGAEQDDMIRSITICGEVLLDTMDHILDYAKISNIETSKDTTRQLAGDQTDFDLCMLCEDIIEGVSAGQSFRLGSTFEAPSSNETHPNDGQIMDINGKLNNHTGVVVVLTIDWQASWIFNSHISSWRRILNNLFQNSIKYTKTGYIHVCLTARVSDGNTIASLSIVDSGKGITKDFLKYELYTPFVQEDPMCIGTGLGLSIVKQLIHDLEGTIDVSSEVGVGTCVKVEIPVSPRISALQLNDALVAQTRKQCRGFSMCLLGFEQFPDLTEIPSQYRSVYEGRMVAIKSSFMTYAGDWFGMIIRKPCSLASTDACVFVCLKSSIGSMDRIERKPMIVFEDDTRKGWKRKEKGVFLLTQPVGPHKLARALGRCVDYHKSLASAPTGVLLPAVDISKPTPILTIATSSAAYKPKVFEAVDIDSPKSIDTIKVVTSKTRDDGKRLRLDLRHISNASSNTLVTEDTVVFPTCQEISQRMLVATTQSIENERSTGKSKNISPEVVVEKKSSRTVVLLVEDNIINLKLLVHGMKKAKEEHTTASNGLEAFQKYKEAPETFKVIFMGLSIFSFNSNRLGFLSHMLSNAPLNSPSGTPNIQSILTMKPDISMPVMDGLDSTRHIREFESENSLPRVRIVALTCFGTEEHRRDAALSGVDIFLTKPIRMAGLKPILDLDPDARDIDAGS
ncbi:hsp90 protein [Rutstroemia sp. NJR-2017a WRK4]|nr:hsp90 protein [Rutstroemia sp. NJR-2017a WRK4]